jgi:hypothetical protein
MSRSDLVLSLVQTDRSLQGTAASQSMDYRWSKQNHRAQTKACSAASQSSHELLKAIGGRDDLFLGAGPFLRTSWKRPAHKKNQEDLTETYVVHKPLLCTNT